jgi:hypothetical protein
MSNVRSSNGRAPIGHKKRLSEDDRHVLQQLKTTRPKTKGINLGISEPFLSPIAWPVFRMRKPPYKSSVTLFERETAQERLDESGYMSQKSF